MMRTVMGALAAMFVSGVAFADVSEAKLDKEVVQLDSDHQQLQKMDTKVATDKNQKAPNEAQMAPEGLGGIEHTKAGAAKTTPKSPAMSSFKEMAVTKGAHDAAKADANMADSAASLGTGASDPKTLKVAKTPHDAAKSDSNMADAAGSIGSGASDPKTLKISKSAHDGAKADANMADASGSIGNGSSTHTLKNERMLGGGQRNDGRSDSSRHEGVHGGGANGHFGGGPAGGAHGGACHHGGVQGC